jgi:hypothetical protein
MLPAKRRSKSLTPHQSLFPSGERDRVRGMSNFKVQIKSKAQMTKKNKEGGNFSELSFKFWSFVIPLTFEL